MTSKYVMPDSKAISSLLEMIFGEGLDITSSDSTDLTGQYVATFLNDDDELVALCACDLPFVAYSGAALSMIPANVANEMIGGGDMTDATVSNFYEVMNICSKLMMSDSSAHLRLGKTLSPDESAEAISALQGSSQVSGFGVDIPRYGKGTLTFLIT